MAEHSAATVSSVLLLLPLQMLLLLLLYRALRLRKPIMHCTMTQIAALLEAPTAHTAIILNTSNMV
jgi:uncharacterized membrane protein YhfC